MQPSDVRCPKGSYSNICSIDCDHDGWGPDNLSELDGRELMSAVLDTSADIHRLQVHRILQVIDLYERDILIEHASKKVATKETVRAVIRKLERRFAVDDGPPPGEDSTRNELYASKTLHGRVVLKADLDAITVSISDLTEKHSVRETFEHTRADGYATEPWAGPISIATARAFPSCGTPSSWTDAHHIEHWLDGGPTDLDNLVLLCGHHHRQIHHSGWDVRLDAQRRPIFTPPAELDPARTPLMENEPDLAA